MENIQELPAVSILSLLETNKDQRQSFVTSVINEIKDGNKSALDIHLQVKCMEDLATALKEDPEYKKELYEATVKQCGGAKNVMYHNAKFEIKEVGTKYDFSQCGDPSLPALIAEADKAGKALKDRQEFLKKAPIDGFDTLDSESGELVKVFPPSKTSTTAVAVTLK